MTTTTRISHPNTKINVGGTNHVSDEFLKVLDLTQAPDFDGMEALQDLDDEQLEQLEQELVEVNIEHGTAWVLAVRDEQDAR